MRSGQLRASLLIIFSSAITFAAPPKPVSGPVVPVSKPVHKPTAQKPAPAAAANPPRVALTMTAPSPNAWKLRVENTGEVPLRFVADARLLSLEIAPPSGKPVHCALPSDARPMTDAGGNAVVLMPKTAFTATIDPRFYCMHQPEGLVAGSKVIPHFGFPSGRIVTAPFVVAPIPEGGTSPAVGGDPPVSAAKEIVGPAITLDESASPKPLPTLSQTADARLTIGLTPRLDAARPNELGATFSVTNTGARASTFLFRPQTLGFDVVGPTGIATRCGSAGESAGIREFFTTLAPKAKTSVAILPTELCPARTFDRAGLYEVRPRLDTRQASGRSVGLHTFDDLVVGPPSLVRIRQIPIDGALPTPTIE
jgi:hypothetical protein